jgi:hypothetical protein
LFLIRASDQTANLCFTVEAIGRRQIFSQNTPVYLSSSRASRLFGSKEAITPNILRPLPKRVSIHRVHGRQSAFCISAFYAEA